MLYPFKMMPVYKDNIWGGYNLKKLGKSAPDSRVAESWELSCMPGSECEIANGSLKGQNLTEIIKKYGRLVLGDKFTSHNVNPGLPILLKFIDANEQLSIQVHPDNEYARVHESKMGKTELWYIIDAEPGASIIHGFSDKYESVRIRDSILNNRHEGLYREVKVKKDDVVFVPAGTVHALNGGIVVAEIQQHSDLTYRLFDYDRIDSSGKKRPLHINKALEVLDYKTHKVIYSGLSVSYEKTRVKYLAVSEYFCVRQIEGGRSPVEFIADGSFSAFMFINGEAEIISGKVMLRADALETVLIPAYIGNYRIEGTFTALQIFIPFSALDMYNSIKTEGFSHKEIVNSVAGVEQLCSR